MIQYIITRLSFTLLLSIAFFTVAAQSNTSSPYSQFGLGLIKGPYTPQNRAMGNIYNGLRPTSKFLFINSANPASYSSITKTVFDIGGSLSIASLRNPTTSQTDVDALFDHILLAMPVGNRAAISFGVMSYSNLGYRYHNLNATIMNGERIITDGVYSADGGLSKAYLGYAYQLGERLSLGVNIAYLFGELSTSYAQEFPADTAKAFLSSRSTYQSHIYGFNIDYGAQYFFNMDPNTALVIGYSGSFGNKINSMYTHLQVRYRGTSSQSPIALDTTFYNQSNRSKISLPASYHIGFILQKTRWLAGADFGLNKWSNFRVGNVDPNLNNSYSMTAGGQFTPDMNSSNNYLKLIDYRLGLRFERTYMNFNNINVKEMALTFGLGLPLRSYKSANKINLTMEWGQRGTLANQLIRERFLNLYLGFFLNDKWFQKYKFD